MFFLFYIHVYICFQLKCNENVTYLFYTVCIKTMYLRISLNKMSVLFYNPAKNVINLQGYESYRRFWQTRSIDSLCFHFTPCMYAASVKRHVINRCSMRACTMQTLEYPVCSQAWTFECKLWSNTFQQFVVA